MSDKTTDPIADLVEELGKTTHPLKRRLAVIYAAEAVMSQLGYDEGRHRRPQVARVRPGRRDLLRGARPPRCQPLGRALPQGAPAGVLRRGRVADASLMTAVSSYRKDLDQLARKEGWSVRRLGSGHLRLTHPELRCFVHAASSPRHPVRSLRNVRATLRRALRTTTN